MCTSVLTQLCCHELAISVPEALKGEVEGGETEERIVLKPKNGILIS